MGLVTSGVVIGFLAARFVSGVIANLAALEKMGWKADDVQITFLAPSDAELACSQGSVDAWSTWEPYVGQEEVLFKSRRVISAEGLTPGLGFQVATAISIRDKRLELTALHRRLAAARAWSLNNTRGYAETWGRLMNIPAGVPLHWLVRGAHCAYRRQCDEG
nr:hypothetical protein [Bradyrhizobium diazoefficiens]